MEQLHSNPYKLSIRRNKDLIRQYNQAQSSKQQDDLISSRKADKQPFITIPNPSTILQYPPGYENQRYKFNSND